MSKYHSPKNLYTDFPHLAENFTTKRKYIFGNPNPSFGVNIAGGELYDVKYPNDYKASIGQSSGYGGGPLTHSERVVMRDLLDQEIPHDFKEGNVIRPSESGKDKETIFSKLHDNAPYYKNYLNKKNLGLDMISELPFCKTKDNNCDSFMKNIAPTKHNFAHTVDGYWEDYKDGIKDSYNRLNKYRDSLKKPQQQSLTTNPFNKVVKTFDEPEQKSTFSSNNPFKPQDESFYVPQDESFNSQTNPYFYGDPNRGKQNLEEMFEKEWRKQQYFESQHEEENRKEEEEKEDFNNWSSKKNNHPFFKKASGGRVSNTKYNNIIPIGLSHYIYF